MAAQFYDTLETRDPAEREAAVLAALPQIIAAAKERSSAYRRLLASVHPKDIVDRRRLGGAAAHQKIFVNRAAAARPAVWRVRHHAALRAPPRFCLARADLRARGPRARLLAFRPGAIRGRVPRRRPRAQHVFLSPHPGRRDGGERRRCAWLPGDPCRHRADRATTAHDRRFEAGRLCRDTLIPESADRPGCQRGQRHFHLAQGAGRGGSPAFGAARRIPQPRDKCAAVLRHRGCRHHCL